MSAELLGVIIGGAVIVFIGAHVGVGVGGTRFAVDVGFVGVL